MLNAVKKIKELFSLSAKNKVVVKEENSQKPYNYMDDTNLPIYIRKARARTDRQRHEGNRTNTMYGYGDKCITGRSPVEKIKGKAPRITNSRNKLGL